MRFRLGLLQDSATLEKQANREAAEALAKKHRHEAPTVKTEAQTKADEVAETKAKERGSEKPKEALSKKPKIRPLSEAKAIDSGANFVSETFLLAVGIALILGENWRKGRQETSRREDVADRIKELEDYEKHARRGLVEMEKEILRLRAKQGLLPTKQARILPREVWELEEKEGGEEQKEEQSWLSWIKGTRKDISETQLEPESSVEVLKPNNIGNETTPGAPTTSILGRILPSGHAGSYDPMHSGHSEKDDANTPGNVSSSLQKEHKLPSSKES